LLLIVLSLWLFTIGSGKPTPVTPSSPTLSSPTPVRTSTFFSLIFFPTSTSTSDPIVIDWKDTICKQSADCTVVETGCCPTCTGGEPVNTTMNSTYESRRQQLDCAGIICPTLLCPFKRQIQIGGAPVVSCVDSLCAFSYVGDQCGPSNVSLCLLDPCAVSSCPNYPGAVCLPNQCSGCNAVWYNSTGTKLNCSSPLPTPSPLNPSSAIASGPTTASSSSGTTSTYVSPSVSSNGVASTTATSTSSATAFSPSGSSSPAGPSSGTPPNSQNSGPMLGGYHVFSALVTNLLFLVIE